LFWYPLAGVTYQFLHYLMGLRRLGYDPYYIEDSGRWIYDRVSMIFLPMLPAIWRLSSRTAGKRIWRSLGFRGNYPDGSVTE